MEPLPIVDETHTHPVAAGITAKRGRLKTRALCLWKERGLQAWGHPHRAAVETRHRRQAVARYARMWIGAKRKSIPRGKRLAQTGRKMHRHRPQIFGRADSAADMQVAVTSCLDGADRQTGPGLKRMAGI